LNIIDVYSKYLFNYPLKQKTAIAVSAAFESFCFSEGMPAILQTDNGLEFCNSDIESFCEEKKIRIVHGRARHPQSQGQIERSNQTLTRKLAKVLHGLDKKAWINHLVKITYAYNITRHRSTQRSPMCLFRGREGFNCSLVSYLTKIKEFFINFIFVD
jgi:transposase InsO family protein